MLEVLLLGQSYTSFGLDIVFVSWHTALILCRGPTMLTLVQKVIYAITVLI